MKMKIQYIIEESDIVEKTWWKNPRGELFYISSYNDSDGGGDKLCVVSMDTGKIYKVAGNRYHSAINICKNFNKEQFYPVTVIFEVKN